MNKRNIIVSEIKERLTDASLLFNSHEYTEYIFRDRTLYGWWWVGRETQIIITKKLRTRLWRI